MLRTIHLHGQLGKRFGKRFELAVNTPNEAIRALVYQVPGFGAYIRHRSYVVTDADGARMGADDMTMGLGSQPAIHVTPAGMVSGVVEVLLGATLLLTAVASVAVLSMPKAPTAASREEATKTASFIFDGPTNVTEQGHVVPLIYGRMRVGSVVVSAGISTTDVNQASVATNPTDPYGNGSYAGYVGTTPGIKGSPAGDEWVSLAKGGKGGSGTTRSAQEDPNTLQSQATAKVLDLIGEGEIVGLVDGLKSVFFDDTPLQNADGTFNFSGVAVEQRYGLPDQDFIPGFASAENTRGLDTPVTVKFGPVTRTVDDANASVARVTIKVPQLYRQDTTNGDLKATTVAVKISVQSDNGGFTDVSTMTFTDRSNSPYQRSMDVRLPMGSQRDIRITRLTPDSETTALSNNTVFDLLTEVVEAKLSYPDCALIGLTVDARQFGSNIPARSYDIKGLIVEVPSNYDPVTRVYTGLWDGTFKRAWTDNPAWVLRDIIVHRRYGLGQRVAKSAVDVWGLYAIAQYCDGMVPDGFGGMEPRYTINCCINNAAAAYDVIASIASNFRGFVYWGSGTVMVAQDRPEDPSILITPSNTVDGSISYGRITPVEKRRSVAVVYWNDPTDAGRMTPEIVEDDDLVRRFGRRGESAEDAVVAYGVSRRGQAHRAARWILEDESPSSNSTAAYAVGDDHSFVEPGRVASIADPKYTRSRRGGRVRSATPGGLRIDAPFTFAAGQNYGLRVMLPNGTASVRPIITTPGTTDQLVLGGDDWQTPPMAGAVWTIESDTIANRQWRVRRITTDEAPYAVEAVLHDPTKYDRVELDRDISTPNFLDLPAGALTPPGQIQVSEFLLRDGNASIPCAQVSWARSDDPRVTFYQAQVKRPGGSYEALADSIDLTRVVRGVDAGEWSFRVRALDSLGRKTGWIEHTATLGGQLNGLPSVLGLSIQTNDDALQAMLVWLSPVDTRPLRFQILYDASGVFGNAVALGVVDTQEYPISQPGTYWVRTLFIDAYSNNPPSIMVTKADLPVVEWENIKDRPTDLESLDPDGAQALKDSLADIEKAVSDAEKEIEGIIKDALKSDGIIEGLGDATRDLGKIQHQAERDLTRIDEAVVRGLLDQDRTREEMRDAGITLDPATGKARIWAIEQVAERLSHVDVTLDAQAATIRSKASVDQVTTLIAEAVLEPGQAAELGPIVRRITSAETTIDGLNAAVAAKAEAIDLTEAKKAITTAESRLDALDGSIELKVEKTEFDKLGVRVGAAELVLEALPDVSTFSVELRKARISDAAGDEAAIRAMLADDAAGLGLRIQIANYRQDASAQIVDGLSAEANARTRLAATVAGNNAVAEQRYRTFASADEAAVEAINALVAENRTQSVAISEVREAGLSLSGGVAGIRTTIRQVDKRADASDESLVRGMLADDAAKQATARSIALVDMDLRTTLVANERASAVATQTLLARILGNESSIVMLSRAVSDNASATAESIRSLKATIDNEVTGLPGLAASILDANKAIVEGGKAAAKSVSDLAAAIFDESTGAIPLVKASISELDEAVVEGGKAAAKSVSDLSAQIFDPVTGAIPLANASITEVGKAVVEGDKASAELIRAVSAKLGDLGSATVSELIEVVVSENDKIRATRTLAIDTNGNVVGTQLVGSEEGRGVLNFINADLNMGTGRIVLASATVMQVQGIGFGKDLNLLEWFGPRMAIADCSTANAVSYKTITGDEKMGGTLSAGIIKNAVQTTNPNAGASVSTGKVRSNGRRRVVVFSYSFYRAVTSNQTTNPRSGQISAEVKLYRNGVALPSLFVAGEFNSEPYGGVNSPAQYYEDMGGTMTITDDTGGNEVEYTATVSVRTLGPGPAGNVISDTVGQTISIIETEE